MAFTKFIYNLINWKNKSESLTTPLGATNLNKMDSAIKKINDNLNSAYDEISSEKLDKSTAYTMVKDVTYNSGTGVFTVTKLNGTTLTIDTKLEKIVTNWKYDKDSQKLILTLDDGTTQEVDLSALITQYEFKDSDTIAFTVESDGSVTANVKDGSITDKKIQPNYLADIKTQASNAETSAQNAFQYAENASYDAKLAQSYAIGGSGIRDGEETNNAKYYSEQANNEANNASGYAESASSFAENSSRSASYASSYANTASTHATNAEASAQSANKSANSASGYAENANTSAELANRSASYASSYANTASTHASNASASAQSASDSASAAEESAKNAKAEADKIAEIAGGDIVLQSEKGAVNGVAPLDGNALIPLEYVPDNPLLKDNASKNLLEVTATSKTASGVTFTVNNDGTISLSGMAVSDQSIELGVFTFKANEKYIVSGSPTGGAEAKYFLYGAKTNLRDYGAGRETTFSQDTTESLWFIVKSGTDVTGLTIKPMIRRAEIKDDAYEPYYASNKELTEIVKEGSVNSAIQDGNGNKIDESYARKLEWINASNVGKWSRVCSITGTATSYLLNVKISQNNQATCYTYVVNTGYGTGYMSQIGASGYGSNNNLQIRLVRDSSNMQLFYVEILNDYGYNGANAVNVQCAIIGLYRYNNEFNVTTYTAHTDTVEGDTVVSEIHSKAKGIVSYNFYGQASAITDTTDIQAHSVQNSLHAGNVHVNGNGNFGLYDITNDKWVVVSDKNGNVYLYGNADTATKADMLSTTTKDKISVLCDIGALSGFYTCVERAVNVSFKFRPSKDLGANSSSLMGIIPTLPLANTDMTGNTLYMPVSNTSGVQVGIMRYNYSAKQLYLDLASAVISGTWLVATGFYIAK